MTSQKLAYFSSLSKTLNFTRTAEHFYVTQTAITQQIHSIEEELGVTLIDRSQKKIRLTPAGEVFAIECDRLLQELEESSNRVKLIGGKNGLLHIWYPNIAVMPSLPAALRQFSTENPNVHIELSSAYFPFDTLAQITKYDAILTVDASFHLPTEYKRMFLWENHYCIAVPASHPLAANASVKLSDLQDEVLINAGKGATWGRLIQQDFFRAGLSVGNIIRAENLNSSLLLCSMGKGISILIDRLIPSLPVSLNLRYIPLSDDFPQAPTTAFYRKDNSNPSLPLFLQTLRSIHTEAM